jgi:hypothetical protein
MIIIYQPGLAGTFGNRTINVLTQNAKRTCKRKYQKFYCSYQKLDISMTKNNALTHNTDGMFNRLVTVFA